MNEKETSPLVSIVVITYNSSQFILETLESAKNQTYENVELIISDDASTDETVPICREWLSQNQEKFFRTELLTTDINTGTSGNCNRGLKASTGKWVKFIAGDDILLSNCISANVSFSVENKSSINFSKMNFFKDGAILKTGTCTIEQKRFINKSQIKKRKSYIRSPIFLNIPTLFFSTEVLKKVGGFNENFRLLEDQPLIFKILFDGYDILFLDKTTVNYRIHGGSITGNGNMNFIKELYKSYGLYRRPYLKNYNLLDLIFKIYTKIDFYFRLKGLSRTLFYLAFNKLTTVIRALS